MKAIFLDIDGVMNCSDTPCAESEIWLVDPILVGRLNRLCSNVKDVIVVLSSSWKYAHRKKMIDINVLLEAQGYNGPKITEITPEIEDVERGFEIEAWLKGHPEVDGFVILDDNDDMNPLMDHWIETGYYDGGLKDEHVDEAIRRLNIKGDVGLS